MMAEYLTEADQTLADEDRDSGAKIGHVADAAARIVGIVPEEHVAGMNVVGAEIFEHRLDDCRIGAAGELAAFGVGTARRDSRAGRGSSASAMCARPRPRSRARRPGMVPLDDFKLDRDRARGGDGACKHRVFLSASTLTRIRSRYRDRCAATMRRHHRRGAVLLDDRSVRQCVGPKQARRGGTAARRSSRSISADLAPASEQQADGASSAALGCGRSYLADSAHAQIDKLDILLAAIVETEGAVMHLMELSHTKSSARGLTIRAEFRPGPRGLRPK